MAELDDVVGGEIIESTWGNAIRDRTVQRYLNAADRDTKNPTPAAGDVAYLLDTDIVEWWNGSSWRTVFLPLTGGVVTGLTAFNGGMTMLAGPAFPILDGNYVVTYDSATSNVSRALLSGFLRSGNNGSLADQALSGSWQGTGSWMKARMSRGVVSLHIHAARDTAVTIGGFQLGSVATSLRPSVDTYFLGVWREERPEISTARDMNPLEMVVRPSGELLTLGAMTDSKYIGGSVTWQVATTVDS